MSFTRSETATRNTVSMERQDTFHHLNEAAERAKQLARQDTKTMVLTRSQSITPGSDATTHATRRPSCRVGANLLTASTTDSLLSFQTTGLGVKKSPEAQAMAQAEFREEVRQVRGRLNPIARRFRPTTACDIDLLLAASARVWWGMIHRSWGNWVCT